MIYIYTLYVVEEMIFTRRGPSHPFLSHDPSPPCTMRRLALRCATYVPVSVKKTLLRRGVHIGRFALRAPNQGLESSFCCRIAGQGLVQKDMRHTTYVYTVLHISVYCYLGALLDVCFHRRRYHDREPGEGGGF